ncbi:MAG: G5 domain-containing protein [Clostridia bacterium]|nr:G5 domain-containing protein [Clostridia bacterium]
MEQFKQKIAAFFGGLLRVLRARMFAAAAMGLATVILAVCVSVQSRVVTVNDGDVSRVVLTVHDDPYRVLAQAGVTLDEYDTLNVDVTTSTIDVDRAVVVEVQADGLSTMLHLQGGTVADALDKAGVTVGKYDTVSQSMSDSVSEGMLVKVDRVKYEEYTVTEVIPREVIYRMTAVLKPGVVKMDKAGSDGERVITYRKIYVNGQYMETETVSEVVTKEPVAEKKIKGSDYGVPISKAPFAIQLDSKNQPVNYKQKFSGSCTAYATGKYGASGMRVGVGTIAVNPKQIPYGTKLWITSADGKFVYGYAIAADTGSFVNRGGTLADLYMGSYQEACWFGRRTLNIYVIG